VPTPGTNSEFQHLAVFPRFGYWWVVARDKLPQLPHGVQERLDIITPNGVATRLLMMPEFEPRVTLTDGGLLRFEAWYGMNYSFGGIEPDPHPHENRVAFENINPAANPVVFTDPDFGDRLIVAPIGTRNGVSADYDYPLFSVLASLNGIAIAPKSPEITTRVAGRNLYVTSTISLALSEEHDTRPFEERAPGGRGVVAEDIVLPDENNAARRDMLNLAAWSAEFAGETWDRAQSRLMNAVTSTNSLEERNEARFQLAKFYLVWGAGAEALGVLNFMARADARVVNSTRFQIYRGVALYLMGRYDQAERALSPTTLRVNREVLLFLAAIEARKGNYEYAFPYFMRMMDTIAQMPLYYRTEFSVLATRAALATDDDIAAQAFIEYAADNRNNAFRRAGVHYYRGRINKIMGSFNVAHRELTTAANSVSRWYNALALRALIALRTEIGELTETQALEKLEALRYGWRGDRYEYDLINEIVRRYIAIGRADLALRQLGSSAISFSGTDFGANAHRRMAELFEQIFLSPEAQNLPAARLLALYEDYRELIPAGETGFRIRQNMVDLMVENGLYPEAAEALRTQLAGPFTNRQKQIMGIRLGVVYLLNRQPSEAIAALRAAGELQAVPTHLREIVRKVQAQALVDTGQFQQALDTLGSDRSPDALKIRAESHWRLGQYGQAADALRYLIEKPVDANTLAPGQAEIILNWAAALRLAGREAVLIRVRSNFLGYMRNTPYNEAFDLITSQTTAPAGIEALRNDVQVAERFRTFVDSYVRLLQEGRLSDLVR